METKAIRYMFELNEKEIIYDFTINQYRFDTHFTTEEMQFLVEYEKKLIKMFQ